MHIIYISHKMISEYKGYYPYSSPVGVNIWNLIIYSNAKHN